VAFGKTAKVLLTGAAFRVTGSRDLGRRLVRDFLDGDESARTAAGILLTRAGDKSVGVLAEALDAGPQPAELIDVLASIETPKATAELRRLAGDSTHAASQDAAKTLERRARRGGSR
jgi:hypothetical protein